MIYPTKNYSITEASRELGVHACTIHRWINAGKVKYGRHFVNGRVFIKGEELIKIMNS